MAPACWRSCHIKRLFGNLNTLIGLADEAMELEVGTPAEWEGEHGNDT